MAAILNHARDVLTLAGYDINETRDLPHGHQLRCSGGEIVCVYKTGAVVAQGKGAGAVKALFDASPKPGAVAKPRAAAPRLPQQAAGATQGPSAGPIEGTDGFVPRYPPGWSEEPWDGVTPPFLPTPPNYKRPGSG